MKKFLVIALLAFASCAYSGNTIIAIVNKVPITLNSVQVNLQDSVSKDGQIMIINNYIDNIIIITLRIYVFICCICLQSVKYTKYTG